jgi:hypothetical protein
VAREITVSDHCPSTPAPFAASLRRTRRELLLGCALATALAIVQPEEGAARGFRGTPTTTSGTVPFEITSGTSEVITVSSLSAIVDWAVTAAPRSSGVIDFMPSDRKATFQNGPNNSNFAILNCILPKNSALESPAAGKQLLDRRRR